MNWEKIGKTLLKWGLIGLTLVICIKMIGSLVGKGDDAKKAVSATATQSERVYAKSYNFSNMEGDPVMLKIEVPAGQWVSVKLRTGYDVNKKPHVPMVYDYGDGRPLVHDAPGKKLDSGNVPDAFDVMGEGQEGTLELRCYRIPSTLAAATAQRVAPKATQKKVNFVSKKKKEEDREVKRDDDIPKGPQIF